jgi:hypothetical protein
VLRFLTIAIAFLTAGIAADGRARAGSFVGEEVVYPPKVCLNQPSGHAIYLEFRARTDDEFGHSYVVLQFVDKDGKSQCTGVFGFESAAGNPSGIFTLLGVPGTIGFTGEDLSTKPVERYRIRIPRQTYRNIVRAVDEMRRSWTVYQLLFVNCNSFAGEIAKLAGLQAPILTAVLPTDYIRRLRELNTDGGVRSVVE